LSAKVAQHVERDDQWDPWHEYIHVHQHCDAGFARSTGSFLAPESDCCTSFLCHDALTSNARRDCCLLLLLQSPIRVSGNAYNDSRETWKWAKLFPGSGGRAIAMCQYVASSCPTGGGGASVKRSKAARKLQSCGLRGRLENHSSDAAMAEPAAIRSGYPRTYGLQTSALEEPNIIKTTVTLNCQVGMRNSRLLHRAAACIRAPGPF
jgi:hypothetical protein